MIGSEREIKKESEREISEVRKSQTERQTDIQTDRPIVRFRQTVSQTKVNPRQTVT